MDSTKSNLQIEFLQVQESFTIQNSHQKSISDIDFSPYSEQFITCGGDKSIKLWDINSQQCIFTFFGHRGTINKVKYFNNGKSFISISNDMSIKIWNIRNKWCKSTLHEHQNSIFLLSISEKVNKFATRCFDKIKIWSLNTQQCLKAISNLVGAYDVNFSPNGQFLAYGEFQNIVILETKTYQRLFVINQAHELDVQSISFANDSKTLISCGQSDKIIKIWEIQTKICINTLKDHNSNVRFAKYSYTGEYIISYEEDKRIIIWDSFTLKAISTFQSQKIVTSAKISPDGKRLAFVGVDKKVNLVSMENQMNVPLIQIIDKKIK